MAGIWLALPWRTVQLLALLLPVAAGIATLRLRSRPKRPPRPVPLWIGRVVAAAALALGLWLLVPALAGRSPAGETVDLRFPFASGRFIVANGGSTERVNAHLMTLGPEYARWRGESYGVDLIRVDSLGFRTRERRPLALPSDPSLYLSWNEPVRAPCSGTVLAAEEARPDMPVPVRDRENLEGNYVLMRCGAVEILLAHFRRDGIETVAGRTVEAGQLLGFVGNSGNTDEPHLHVHAQRTGPEGAPLAGDPLFITFDGRFPVRNKIFEGVRP